MAGVGCWEGGWFTLSSIFHPLPAGALDLANVSKVSVPGGGLPQSNPPICPLLGSESSAPEGVFQGDWSPRQPEPPAGLGVWGGGQCDMEVSGFDMEPIHMHTHTYNTHTYIIHTCNTKYIHIHTTHTHVHTYTLFRTCVCTEGQHLLSYFHFLSPRFFRLLSNRKASFPGSRTKREGRREEGGRQEGTRHAQTSWMGAWSASAAYHTFSCTSLWVWDGGSGPPRGTRGQNDKR